MNIQRAKQEITNTVRAYLTKDEQGEYTIPALRQRPILLMGPPGIGKTQIMEQVARECGVALVSYTITHHTRQSAVGLPFIRQRTYGGKDCSVTEYTMSEIIASVYETMERTGLHEGILFIDEINCVSETLAPTMLQFLQAKRFGNQSVPSGWVIAAAGNPPEYNKSVRDFDVVTLDRVKRMDIEPDYPAFKAYARAARLHPAILAYLELHPDHFYQIQADVDGTQFVTARGWEDLSELLYTYQKLGISADEEVVHQYLQHSHIAEEFSAYLDLYQKYQDDYGVEEILDGKAPSTVFARLMRAPFDERLALVSLLLSGLTGKFQKSAAAGALADAAFDFIKAYHARLESTPATLELSDADQQTAGIPVQLLREMAAEQKADYELKFSAGLLSKDSASTSRRLTEILADWVRMLEEANPANGEAALPLLKNAFRPLADARTHSEDLAGAALEYAFDFMEQAFGTGQEMVVFVTELTLSPLAQQYINENGCDRYFAYNRTLLLDSRRAALQSELVADELRNQ